MIRDYQWHALVSYGAPHGSVLGHIHFLLYMLCLEAFSGIFSGILPCATFIIKLCKLLCWSNQSDSLSLMLDCITIAKTPHFLDVNKIWILYIYAYDYSDFIDLALCHVYSTYFWKLCFLKCCCLLKKPMWTNESLWKLIFMLLLWTHPFVILFISSLPHSIISQPLPSLNMQTCNLGEPWERTFTDPKRREQ